MSDKIFIAVDPEAGDAEIETAIEDALDSLDYQFADDGEEENDGQPDNSSL